MGKIKKNILGLTMYEWAKDLFPFHRSITGEGVRNTLFYIKNKLPKLKIYSVKSGTKAFDWIVPEEWSIKDAYIKNAKGKKIVDYKKSNLHVLGYSTPVNKKISYKELNKKLYSDPKIPSAIPYRTSYYKKNWGFCLTEKQRKTLNKKEKYSVSIDSKLFKGKLNYGEIILPGKSKKEIFLSCNICHPSLANNELSGPIVTTALANWISKRKRKYTYRIIFIPETIGAIVYLSKNYKKMKKNIIAGFVIACVGDDRSYSFLKSRHENTLADKATKLAFQIKKLKYKEYSFLDRGSDERQYCSPGIDLPVCSIMRTKYGEFPEYHTSKDNLSLISPKGLLGAFEIISLAIEILEINKIYKTKNFCEPFLTKFNLKKTLGGESKINNKTKIVIDLLAYLDGSTDLIDISKKIKVNIFTLNKIVTELNKLKLIS